MSATKDDFLRDLKREMRDIRNALDDVDSSLDDLNSSIEDMDIPLIDDSPVVREAVEYGLVTIEAKYGISSKEAASIREFLHPKKKA